MAPHKTITVNGRQYDAITGLPVKESKKSVTTAKPQEAASVKPVAASRPAAQKPAAAAPRTTAPRATTQAKAAAAPRRPQQAYHQDIVRTKKPAAAAAAGTATAKAPLASSATTASAIHAATLQHSETLNRRSARKPAVNQKPLQHTKPAGTRQMDVSRSKRITHFAANPVVPEKPPVKTARVATSPDVPAQTHPIAHRALAHLPTRKKGKEVSTAAPKTSKQIKEEEIERALAAPKPAPTKKARKAHKKRVLSTKARIAIVVGSIAAVLLIVAYVVYCFVPTVSVNVAASQAGISATYPEYTPDGYTLHQPVSYKDGEVDLKFASNSNSNYYTITQTRSSWDSSAVLDNVVTPAVGDDYVTTKERGLTIYTYGSVATWVNGGILYTIDSKAPLSGEQIRRIATSL